jgi:lysozyme family protein
VARANGYQGDMRDLSVSKAYDIARTEYWNKAGLEYVDEHCPRVAEELFDTGYNMGAKVAAVFLQRSLNVLNRSGQDYDDISVDGEIGPRTGEALRLFCFKRGPDGETVLLRMLNSLQGARYIEIAENREANETFVFGWFLKRVAI